MHSNPLVLPLLHEHPCLLVSTHMVTSLRMPTLRGPGEVKLMRAMISSVGLCAVWCSSMIGFALGGVLEHYGSRCAAGQAVRLWHFARTCDASQNQTLHCDAHETLLMC